MLNFAKNQGLTKGYENIFHRADALALPYPDGAFKFAMAASFISVVPNPVAALRELIRVTKPSGKLSVLLPNVTMTPANSQQYSAEHRLAPIESALLHLWASRARKMSEQEVTTSFGAAGLRDWRVRSYLDGMVLAVTGSC